MINKDKRHRSVKMLFDKGGRGLNTAYRCYLQESAILFFAKKYSGLTQDEVLICTLIAFNMPATEISVMLNKLNSNIRASIYRIMAKFGLTSVDSLYERLMLELPSSFD